MPYCVYCGVQLNDHARECPLCHTRVFLPEQKHPPGITQSPKLEKEIVDDDHDRRLWIKIISITMFTPSVIALLGNWIFQQKISWSLFVASSMLFVWVWSVSLFFFKENRFQKWLPIAWISLLGFLFAIEYISKSFGWFFRIALPIVTSLFIIILMISVMIRKKLIRELQIPAFIVLGVGLFWFVINGSISFFNDQTIRLDWSLIVMVTCIAFALIGIVLQQRPMVVEKIKHWFYV